MITKIVKKWAQSGQKKSKWAHITWKYLLFPWLPWMHKINRTSCSNFLTGGSGRVVWAPGNGRTNLPPGGALPTLLSPASGGATHGAVGESRRPRSSQPNFFRKAERAFFTLGKTRTQRSLVRFPLRADSPYCNIDFIQINVAYSLLICWVVFITLLFILLPGAVGLIHLS